MRAGDLLFVSGIVPVDENRELVGGDDVVAQARKVFDNMGDVLAAAGCSFADVVKVTVFLTDVNDRPLVNPVRQQVFGDDPAGIDARRDLLRWSFPARRSRSRPMALLPDATWVSCCHEPSRGDRGCRAARCCRTPLTPFSRAATSSSRGILPADATGALVGGDDVVAQAEHVFGDMGEILAAAGCSFADVAKVTVFLTDVADRAAINPMQAKGVR